MNHDLIRGVERARFSICNRYDRKYLFCGKVRLLDFLVDSKACRAIVGVICVFIDAFLLMQVIKPLALTKYTPQRYG